MAAPPWPTGGGGFFGLGLSPPLQTLPSVKGADFCRVCRNSFFASEPDGNFMEEDLKKIRASKMKSNSWFKQFNVFFQADRKEWETLTGESFSEVNPSDLQSRLFELRRQSGLTAPATP